MKFDLKKPCDGCPFTIQPGAVKLREGRVDELASMIRNDNFLFPCHKTVDDDEDDDDFYTPGKNDQFCVGALVLFEREHGQPPQYVRIRERIERRNLTDGLDGSTVYDDVEGFEDGAVFV